MDNKTIISMIAQGQTQDILSFKNCINNTVPFVETSLFSGNPTHFFFLCFRLILGLCISRSKKEKTELYYCIIAVMRKTKLQICLMNRLYYFPQDGTVGLKKGAEEMTSQCAFSPMLNKECHL